MTTKYDIEHLFANIPIVKEWPALSKLLAQLPERDHPDWELVLKASRAVGGNDTIALPGAAALACLQLSIILIDDILDEDVRGAYRIYGTGTVSNWALALQSAAFALVPQMQVSADTRTRITACLAQMALETAYGQALDTSNLKGEESYWRVVRSKSTPFYRGAYELGALLGGASVAQAQAFGEYGALTGEIIQIEDDLDDAFATPANADWLQERNNLLILYARTAEHAERSRFLQLHKQAANPEQLAEAQSVLQRSGAVAYCAIHLLQRFHRAERVIANLSLADPQPIQEMQNLYSLRLQEFLGVNAKTLQEMLASLD